MTVRLADRLPSALAALALQAGLFALLVISIEVVHRLPKEKETILSLPPLVRPSPASQPVTVDARGRKPPGAAPRAASPPAYALPSFGFTAPQDGDATRDGTFFLQELGRDLSKCRAENYGNLNASERNTCPPPGQAQRDPDAVLLNPGPAVKNAPIWQAEVDRRNAPTVIPGGDPLGALLTLFGNPGAFLDKRSYSAAGPEAPPMDGAEAIRQQALHGSSCPALDDTSNRICQAGRAALYEHGTTPRLLPSHPHVSDTAFQRALAATQARTRSLYGAPVLASGGKAGSKSDEKSGTSGNNGAPAAGGTGHGGGGQ